MITLERKKVNVVEWKKDRMTAKRGIAETAYSMCVYVVEESASPEIGKPLRKANLICFSQCIAKKGFSITKLPLRIILY